MQTFDTMAACFPTVSLGGSLGCVARHAWLRSVILGCRVPVARRGIESPVSEGPDGLPASNPRTVVSRLLSPLATVSSGPGRFGSIAATEAYDGALDGSVELCSPLGPGSFSGAAFADFVIVAILVDLRCGGTMVH